MNPKEPEINNEPTFTTDETIKETDEEKSIKYIATEGGYIALEGSVYTIKSEMDIGEISFKTTGNIAAGVDSEVNLNVKENDAMKDAIGNGMLVEVHEIDIDGNVGSNAKVIAKRATVAGQTHKTAVVIADDLTINTHRGKAIGENITITRLEHGVVNGEVVKIDEAVGGHIRGKDIEIGTCASYVHATASRRIEIEKLHGSENIFMIDPLLQESKLAGLEENEDEIHTLESDTKNFQEEIEKLSKIVKNDTEAFNAVKKKLIHYKKNGIKMPEAFVNKYKKFLKIQEHLEAIKKEYKTKSSKLVLLTTKTASFQDDIFHARIINKDRWTDHNEIIFKLVDPPMELSFKPQEGSPDRVFGIVETDDGDYEIQAVTE